jgi:hypothetical protein
MPSQNPFRKSNHSRGGSSAYTTYNVGGGDKKAGFPYQIGRSYGVSNRFNSTDPVHGHCCLLKNYNNTIFPIARQSRNIGSTANGNYRYWHIPGTKQ